MKDSIALPSRLEKLLSHIIFIELSFPLKNIA